MSQLIYKSESYKIVGLCMEVHRVLGKGFSEIVYKDALEYEFKAHGIPFQREREFIVTYKDTELPHKFYADFFVWDKIILEVKSTKELTNIHYEQVLNYLAVSDSKLGLIVNFSNFQLDYKRLLSRKLSSNYL